MTLDQIREISRKREPPIGGNSFEDKLFEVLSSTTLLLYMYLCHRFFEVPFL